MICENNAVIGRRENGLWWDVDACQSSMQRSVDVRLEFLDDDGTVVHTRVEEWDYDPTTNLVGNRAPFRVDHGTRFRIVIVEDAEREAAERARYPHARLFQTHHFRTPRVG